MIGLDRMSINVPTKGQLSHAECEFAKTVCK